jgi:hypothetical protein
MLIDAACRSSGYELHQIISWSGPEPAAQRSAMLCNRAFGNTVQSFGAGGYVNTNSGDSGGDSPCDEHARVIARLYGSNARRLLDVKKVYDPDNLFHHNSNIRETACATGFVLMHE